MMMASAVRTYNGRVFGEGGASEVIRAKSLDGAKKQMEKSHGSEYAEDGSRNWVVGLSAESFAGSES
jgi:hypothetical protein